MHRKKFWILFLCFGLLVPLMSFAQTRNHDRDVDRRDLRGISPHHFKYIVSTLGGAAAGAGLGYLLPGEKTPAKLALIGGGAASTWYLHSHRDSLGPVHDWAMIGSNTVLGTGIGWLGCNCHDGMIGGALLGGGITATWEALKNDRAAHNTFRRVKGQ